MTTEEKLDRLTDRVDGIAESLELLASLHRDLEVETARGFAETRERFAETDKKFAEMRAETAKGFAEIRVRFAETLVLVNGLAHVAQSHEQRLDRLEAK